MKPLDFVLVRADDWTGLYKNGVLIYEDHSIDLETYSEIVGIPCPVKWADDDWLIEAGHLPELLSDVKLSPNQ